MMSRGERRSIHSDRCIDVYAADSSRGWRVTRQVTAEYAYEKVVVGNWREVYDTYGTFLGCQVLARIRTDSDMPSSEDGSTTTITAPENKRASGLNGISQTIRMCEEQRITRHSRAYTVLPPEDLIERAMIKVRQWPLPASRIDNGRGLPVYGDRACRVYPRI
jgi:hypothetical protein